jgi:NAD(P)-dependent dehydrogenase (short-subunit alcohol dehydrogenase family)
VSSINELLNLSNRNALITGATGNLGKIFADTLAELGANLILVDLKDTSLKDLKKMLTSKWQCKVDTYECDLENNKERSNLIDQVNRSYSSLSILLNNAAFVGTSDLQGWNVPFENQSLATWNRVLELNLTSIFDLTQGFLKLLRTTGNASIVNIASIYGVLGPDWSLYKDTGMSNSASYATSKGGLIQLTRWLSTTICPEVRVNSISPGGILRNQSQIFTERYESRVPLGRMGTEEDYRGILAYLASDLSRYTTGQNFCVDGGWSVW